MDGSSGTRGGAPGAYVYVYSHLLFLAKILQALLAKSISSRHSICKTETRMRCDGQVVAKGTKGMAVLTDDDTWHFCVVTKVREQVRQYTQRTHECNIVW